MNNFEFTHERKKYWYSRSMAVVGVIISFDEIGYRYVLAGKRGKDTPDPQYIGKWCLPCGYLDFNESLEECISRETFEETGIKINKNKWQIFSIDSDPEEDKRQNVTVRFGCVIEKMPIICYEPNNEVADATWIKINEINNYAWAFNHKELINKYGPII
jgi:ADP-ribose pyrophosphatase YjhB (NUDIX family)